MTHGQQLNVGGVQKLMKYDVHAIHHMHEAHV